MVVPRWRWRLCRWWARAVWAHLRNLDEYDVGRRKTLRTFRVYLPGEAYTPVDAKAQRVRDLVERIDGLPGVEAVFASNMVPLGNGGGGGNLHIDGVAVEAGKEPYTELVGVTPGFLRTLGKKVIAGEDFTEAQGWSRTPLRWEPDRRSVFLPILRRGPRVRVGKLRRHRRC